jgi:hypothetical protein
MSIFHLDIPMFDRACMTFREERLLYQIFGIGGVAHT